MTCFAEWREDSTLYPAYLKLVEICKSPDTNATVRCRNCGCTERARNERRSHENGPHLSFQNTAYVASLTPALAAMVRVLQCVELTCLLDVVTVTIHVTFRSVM